jgi:hypothetical protein
MSLIGMVLERRNPLLLGLKVDTCPLMVRS